MKIYTKTGDAGETSLYGGKRVSKSDLQIEAFGILDELNVYVGYLRSKEAVGRQKDILKEIQDRIFSVGSYLASDFNKEKLFKPELKLSDIELLENQIDEMELELTPLTNFVLPGGNETVSLAHLARVVCRRSERVIVAFYSAIGQDLEEKEFVLKYLNRLSDYFFVLSRLIGLKSQAEEFIWIPRK